MTADGAGLLARPSAPSDPSDPDAAVLTAEEFALFAQVGRVRPLEPGERLFRRGDLGTTMYVVAQGAIEGSLGAPLEAFHPDVLALPGRLEGHEAL